MWLELPRKSTGMQPELVADSSQKKSLVADLTAGILVPQKRVS